MYQQPQVPSGVRGINTLSWIVIAGLIAVVAICCVGPILMVIASQVTQN